MRVLDDGRIRFQGSASQLMAAQDSFLKKYLLLTLPPWSAQSTPPEMFETRNEAVAR